MPLILTEEQKLLAQTVRRFVGRRTPLTAVRELLSGGRSHDPEVWQQISGELGLTGFLVPDEYGGSGGTLGDLSVALRALGGGLVPSPLLASGVLAAGLLVELDDKSVKHEWLPRLASGEAIGALATTEPGAGAFIPALPTTRATQVGSAVVLSGTKTAVISGADADVLLVQARTATGAGIYLVEASADGLTRHADRTVDLTASSATVTFDATPAVEVAGDTVAALDRIVDLANVAIASTQSGALEACLTMTTDFAKTRYTFGQPIGAYQGVKHKLADMYNLWALSDAALRAAVRAAEEEPERFAAAAAAARSLTSAGYLSAAKDTMLLHGGIGCTWDHDAHLYYRNAIAGNVLAGSADDLHDRIADKLGI